MSESGLVRLESVNGDVIAYHSRRKITVRGDTEVMALLRLTHRILEESESDESLPEAARRLLSRVEAERDSQAIA